MVAYNNVITFGGDFIYSRSDTLNHVGQLLSAPLGISNPEKYSSNSISVYPNPADDKINIEFKDFSMQKECYVKILDEMGREVFAQKMKDSEFSMNMSGNSAGLYTVKVVDGDGNTMGVKRIVLR